MNEKPNASGFQQTSFQQDLNDALKFHMAGDFPRAESIYKRVLQAHPNQPIALHLLGITAHQQGKNEAALSLIEQALSSDPGYMEAHINLCKILKSLGRLDDLVPAYERTLSLAPNSAELTFELALVLQDLGRLDEAQITYRRALALKPDYFEAYTHLGDICKKTGQLIEAETCYRKALAINPEAAELHNNLGDALLVQQQWKKAAASYVHALTLKPDMCEAHYNLGNALSNQGRGSEAVFSYQKAYDLNPHEPRYLLKLGNCLYELERFQEAGGHFITLLEIEPHNIMALNNLGNVYKRQGDLKQATDCYLKALDIQPDDVITYINFSDVQIQQGNLEAAVKTLETAIQIDPTHAVAHWNLSLVLLMCGDLKRGLELNEWRWKTGHTFAFRHRDFPFPKWDGLSLQGKRILVWAEQGIGDELYFASLYPQLLAQGAKCIFEVEHRLVDLMQRSFPDAVVVERLSPPAPEAMSPGIDFQCAAGSLMRFFLTSFDGGASRENYLVADADRVKKLRARYLTAGIEKVVGLGWSTPQLNNAKREDLPIEIFDPILQTPGVRFVNLQYGDRQAELDAAYERTGVRIYQDEDIDPLQDMDGFAAQESAMDLVISNVNSTAVLAAGLGVPVWGLVPTISEWRTGNERDHCLWFPSMPLFRQSVEGDWASVQQDLVKAFSQWRETPIHTS